MGFFNGNIKFNSLRNKLLIWLIPPVVIILFVTGYVTNHVSQTFIHTALERNAKIQAMAIAHEVNEFLNHCKQDLLFFSQNIPTMETMRDFLENKRASGGILYRELAYISQIDKSHLYLISNKDSITEISLRDIPEIRPNPLLLYSNIKDLPSGEIFISSITEVEHPFPTLDNPNQKIASKVIYLVTPFSSKNDGARTGFLLLSLDAKQLRNIFSIYNSPKSPIWAYPRTQEHRYSYMFDKEGWMLFQSIDPDRTEDELSTDSARASFNGTLGRPGIPNAFRPGSIYGNYWKMIGDIREGKHGLILGKESGISYGMTKEYFKAYAPIIFAASRSGPPLIYGGVAYIDRSRLTLMADYRHIDVMFIITLATVIIVAIVLYLLGKKITRPIVTLTRAVDEIHKSGEFKEILIPLSGYETISLQAAINNMIKKMKEQSKELEVKEQVIEQATLKEIAKLEEEIPEDSRNKEEMELPELIGFGTKIEKLKSEIIKAANVDVDVLILGETGTGKQLAAEATHNHSHRSGKSFISINCGELDENLLLDTLFGHVKGAFTEAKTDRKGAFLEADGGTLFLDEIQSASLSVQQALLRAIAMRKIKPLGSDRELDVNVRLIAATNADLNQMIDEGRFRQDLYFRLKVLTIQTPPLREQIENIPILTIHFLKQVEMLANKNGLGLSKGALEKMRQYRWPGNVRELMNVITRAVVMTENKIIQADDIDLEGGVPVRLVGPMPTGIVTDNSSILLEDKNKKKDKSLVSDTQNIPDGLKSQLNSRQLKAMGIILQEREITRIRYQEIIGKNLPSRTAIYDLQDLVKKGVLKKAGQGPATRYIPVNSGNGRAHPDEQKS
jgi:DNA-binding NtrC family response regulator